MALTQAVSGGKIYTYFTPPPIYIFANKLIFC